MADQGLRDIPELRDDALAFLQHSPPSASRAGSVGETPQPAATGSHSMAGKGHSREGAPSNSNLSDRSLFEFRAGKRGARGALDGVVGIVVLIFSSVQHRDHSANARA